MKTIITIENNPIGGSKVTVQVDDGVPTEVEQKLSRTEQALQNIVNLNTNMRVDAVKHGLPITPMPPLKMDDKEKVGSIPPVKVSPAPKKSKTVAATRSCIVCGEDISSLDKRRKLCVKPECQKEWSRRYAQEWNQKNYVPAKKKPEDALVVSQEAAPTPVAPQFMPGHEKTPEEIEQWRPKTFNVPTDSEMPKHTPSERVASDFADPWNCQMCRDLSKVCDFHQRMEDSGSRPPKTGGRAS